MVYPLTIEVMEQLLKIVQPKGFVFGYSVYSI